MQIKLISSLLILLSLSSFSWAQTDFSVHWNAYETGDIIEDDPFNGSFTIRNNGSDTIFMEDTLWYGYLIEGEKYDLGLNLDLVSGEVLDEDLEPGDEIVVLNSFSWPGYWESGSTIDVCAVVFGTGTESYEGEYFTGDINPENNVDCIEVIVPIYTTGLSQSGFKQDDFKVFITDEQLIISTQLVDDFTNNLTVSVFSSFGKLVLSQLVEPNTINNISVVGLAQGVYIVNFVYDNKVFNQKIYLP